MIRRVVVEALEVERTENYQTVVRAFDSGGRQYELLIRRRRLAENLAAVLRWTLDPGRAGAGVTKVLEGRRMYRGRWPTENEDEERRT
jgi:hypothetical protein